MNVGTVSWWLHLQVVQPREREKNCAAVDTSASLVHSRGVLLSYLWPTICTCMRLDAPTALSHLLCNHQDQNAATPSHTRRRDLHLLFPSNQAAFISCTHLRPANPPTPNPMWAVRAVDVTKRVNVATAEPFFTSGGDGRNIITNILCSVRNNYKLCSCI